jgi:hypothetical protein
LVLSLLLLMMMLLLLLLLLCRVRTERGQSWFDAVAGTLFPCRQGDWG